MGHADTRKKYDELGANWKQYENSGFSGFGGGGQGGAGFDIRDFMGGMGGGRRSTRPAKGSDLNATINMTLLEAYQGSQRMIDLGGNTIKITIKPGVRDGQVLRIKGKGNPGRNGGDNGDLLIKVSITNDHVYQRDGDDLIRNINVDVYTAILGGKITVTTLKGDVNVPIKPQTQNNSTLRLKGMGMPHYDKEGAGALLLKVQLLLPEHFSQKELELIKEARELKSENLKT